MIGVNAVFRKFPEEVGNASEIPSLFKSKDISYDRIGIVNCPKYPAVPDVRFAAVHNGDNILIHYIVHEETSQALYLDDQSPVCKDSCCELFISFGEEGYYNIECNCIGTILAGFGKGREGRIPLPSENMQKISRWSSLPRSTFEEKHIAQWQLALAIPISTFCFSNLPSFDGLCCRANFFKCAQALTTTHFLSWADITFPDKPSFHCPEFFPEVEFGR